MSAPPRSARGRGQYRGRHTTSGPARHRGRGMTHTRGGRSRGAAGHSQAEGLLQGLQSGTLNQKPGALRRGSSKNKTHLIKHRDALAVSSTYKRLLMLSRPCANPWPTELRVSLSNLETLPSSKPARLHESYDHEIPTCTFVLHSLCTDCGVHCRHLTSTFHRYSSRRSEKPSAPKRSGMDFWRIPKRKLAWTRRLRPLGRVRKCVQSLRGSSGLCRTWLTRLKRWSRIGLASRE